jgi:PHD finger-like domain-containing protein 5A
MAARHHPDLIMCRKQPGTTIGRLCEKCDGKCVVCDSYVRPHTLVRLCDECNFGASLQGRCTICGAPGFSDAYYCKECVQQEKDVSAPIYACCASPRATSPPSLRQRDGCPKVLNIGMSKQDRYYDRKKYAGVKQK